MTQAPPGPDAWGWSKVAWTLFGALVATTVGYVGRYLERRSALLVDSMNSRFDEVCAEIDRLSDLAATYWSLEGDANAETLKIAALDVKSSMHRVRSILGYLEADMAGLMDSVESQLERLSDKTTGDTFEVNGRAAERHRIFHIKTAANNLVLALRAAQRKHHSGWHFP